MITALTERFGLAHPVMSAGIPLRIRNSFHPERSGTRVSVEGRPSPTGVKAITSIRDVSLVAVSGRGMQGIPGIAARAFGAVATERANVLMISQASSENNICLVVRSDDAARVVRALRAALEFDILKGHIDDVTADDTIAVIAAVGDKMKGVPGIGSLLISGSRMYGMTGTGGTANLGTIFEMNLDGTGYAVMHSFLGGPGDGNGPMGDLTLVGGTLYGMTGSGGTSNFGTIFSIPIAVPEPSTLLLVGGAAAGLAYRARRQARRSG